MFISFLGLSQEKNEITYKIISNPNNLDVQPYIEALDKSNFECFRFETKGRVLTFKTGVVIELISYDKVIEAGVIQKNNCFLQDNVEPLEYELDLVGAYISVQVPYDKNLKRVSDEK